MAVCRMLRQLIASALLIAVPVGALPQEAQRVTAQDPSLTIYNSDFAVVRQPLQLDLAVGTNSVRFQEATSHLEPDSVILRDLAGTRQLRILEQSYRSDPVSEAMLMSLFEGKSIDFELVHGTEKRIVSGKIIRSGYLPNYAAMGRYGAQYYQAQMAYANSGATQPIIEIEGRLFFGLPGRPIFPSLGKDTILKPSLDWQLHSDKAGPLSAELSYITGGMRWEADYNIVAPEKGDIVEVIGWVTFDNQSGKTFSNAQVKLMAGDVNKLQNNRPDAAAKHAREAYLAQDAVSVIREKSFDEFHLYTLERPVTLRDREMKQVEFIRATNVKGQRIYVYDGAKLDQYRGWDVNSIRQNAEYGTQSNPKIWVMQEFKNSLANNLGMPLPKGRLRFYRRDDDGRLEFTGENFIDHTPKDETVRVYTGNAFDMVGERKRVDFQIDTTKRTIDEVFEVRLRNHKSAAAEVRVVEHLNRCVSWQIVQSNYKFSKTESQTAEFRMQVPANGERVLRYAVHYTW